MPNHPLVSVVVPVYNVETLLDRCVESICGQTYDNLQIILVDDGSTDASGKMCDAWLDRDERVMVIHKQNGGLSDARNCGIERATGSLLMFVDSDDYIAPNIVEVLIDTMREGRAEVAICDPVHVHGDESASFVGDASLEVFTPEEATAEMLYQSSFLTAAWGKLYTASCFAEIRFPVGMLFEDSAVMYRVFEKARRVAYRPARLYAYCHRDDSITTKKFDHRDLMIWDICKEIEGHYANGSPCLVSAARSYRMSAALRIYLNAPDGAFEAEVAECERWILAHAPQVLKDGRVRRKTKMALVLFKTCKPLMRFAYGFVDRWA